MKGFLITLTIALGAALPLLSKDVKISVIPEDAQIYVDGNYVGDGVVTVPVKGDFINLKFEKPGYVTIHTKFYKSDKRKSVAYNMKVDTYYEASEVSALANEYFSVTVNHALYTVNEDGTINSDKAWKMVHSILLSYFDEIKSSDMNSGFVQTPWVYKAFPEADIQARLRVTIAENTSGNSLYYKVKVSSEIAELNAIRDDQFTANGRLLKKYEPLIEEIQTRLGE